MNLFEFIKSKMLSICMPAISLVIIWGVLTVYGLPKYSIFYIMFFTALAMLVPLAAEYIKKASFYNDLKESKENLEELFLLSEIIEKPDFLDGEIFYDTLKECNKAMNDKIAEYRIQTEDYKEYIEQWVHEIKTPIAGAKLACENNSANLREDISEELDRIEKYVSQTLFYSRINNANKDYIIKKRSLDYLVANALKSNAKMLIKNGFSIERKNLELTVLTDEKWLTFIMEQIFSNSVKYKSERPRLTFTGRSAEGGIYLDITDNGIGIASEDLPRIFEKNFTGTNGRLNNRSTGFGLYLCKKLCDKMGVEISASSVLGESTTLTIYFPKDNYMDV